MTLNLLVNYFSKLLNSNVNESTVIKLSSGQIVRAYAWLSSNNFDANGLNFRNGFTITQLIQNKQTLNSIASNQDSMPSNFATSSTVYRHIGIDIQSISELFPNGLPEDPKDDPELLSIFTKKELSYAQSKLNPLQTLTGIFSAKEAILKCSKKEIVLTDLEILPSPAGVPYIDGFSISISHSLDFAVAIAISNFGEAVSTASISRIGDDSNLLAMNSSTPTRIVVKSNLINYLIFASLAVLITLEVLNFLK